MRSPAATIAVLALLVAAPAADAAVSGSETAVTGAVSATLTYEADASAIDSELVITRHGSQAWKGSVATGVCGTDNPYCGPTAALAGPPVKSLAVRDLDSDGEPEVLVDIYTGGAHCCTYAEIWRHSGGRYVMRSRSFGNGGYRLEDVGPGGRPQFVARDERFAYAFTAYAFSGLPVRVLSYTRGRWADVTRRHPKLVRGDAARWWAEYRKVRRRPYSRGFAAAWAADQYLLGRRRTALATLRRAARNGRLRGDGPANAFVARLNRVLRSWGY